MRSPVTPRVALALLAAIALAPAALEAGEVTRTLKVEIPVSAGPFTIENLAGAMRVTRGTGAAVVAVATVHAESDALAETMRFEKVEGRVDRAVYRVIYPIDEHPVIRYPQGKTPALLGWLSTGSGTHTKYGDAKVRVSDSAGVLLYADLEIQVPPRAIDAAFRNVVGSLRGSGVEGTLKFDSASGDVDLEKVGGDVTADTGSGDIKAEGVTGSFSCDTGSGDCHLTGFDGTTIDADTGSGDIRVRSATARSVSGDTGSGDIAVEDADIAEFDGDTGSGDILLQVRGARLTRVSADTGSGDVVLRLGPAAAFVAHADQGSGEIINRYSDAQPILEGKMLVGYRRGDGRTKIDVDTGSGDLTLEPGGGHAARKGV